MEKKKPKENLDRDPGFMSQGRDSKAKETDFISTQSLTRRSHPEGAGAMAQQLRALAALPEDPGLHSIHRAPYYPL